MQERKRGFAVISQYKGRIAKLPKRATPGSAGYDICAIEDVVIVPQAVTVVPTGLKAYMQSDEYLGIHIRSSLAIKNGLTLINAQGIIDSDYYNNPDNEGHIMVAVLNTGTNEFLLESGQRFAQAIFYRYLLTDYDSPGEVRQGGIGSTGKNG